MKVVGGINLIRTCLTKDGIGTLNETMYAVDIELCFLLEVYE